MDARNREELLKKKDDLESYLLQHEKSGLFGWYARQNMESGQLDRALKICKLGLAGGENTALMHKLMGECYLAKGEVSLAMQHFIKVILTGEPYPNVIVEVIRNLGDSMEAEQIAYLVRQLNLTLPGHPEATRFYKKYPTARNLKPTRQHIRFLENLVESLEKQESATPPEIPVAATAPVSAAPEDPHQPRDVELQAAAQDILTPPPAEEVPSGDASPEPAKAPFVGPKAGIFNPLQATDTEDVLPPRAASVDLPPPPRSGKSSPDAKHTITRSMATFTLMQIFKDQGMYENAMEVLEILRDKTANQERIDREYQEIQDLIQAGQQKDS